MGLDKWTRLRRFTPFPVPSGYRHRITRPVGSWAFPTAAVHNAVRRLPPMSQESKGRASSQTDPRHHLKKRILSSGNAGRTELKAR
jgi:hypothetical protein